MILLVSLLMALAVAPAPAVFLGTMFSPDEFNGGLTLAFFGVSVLPLWVFFARASRGPTAAFRRGLLILVMEAFVLPLVAYLWGPTEGLVQGAGPGIPGGLPNGVGSQAFTSVGSVIALIVGVPAMVLYFVTKPVVKSGADRD
ncbi:MAG: hypothetical protein EXR58_06665 [Chloroflexi bacterium]|nr:hypothetical protein [Chloroflexota bacterium]